MNDIDLKQYELDPIGLVHTPKSREELDQWIEKHDNNTKAMLYIVQSMYYNLIVDNFYLVPKER